LESAEARCAGYHRLCCRLTGALCPCAGRPAACVWRRARGRCRWWWWWRWRRRRRRWWRWWRWPSSCLWSCVLSAVPQVRVGVQPGHVRLHRRAQHFGEGGRCSQGPALPGVGGGRCGGRRASVCGCRRCLRLMQWWRRRRRWCRFWRGGCWLRCRWRRRRRRWWWCVRGVAVVDNDIEARVYGFDPAGAAGPPALVAFVPGLARRRHARRVVGGRHGRRRRRRRRGGVLSATEG
jgi:hypothetical protein